VRGDDDDDAMATTRWRRRGRVSGKMTVRVMD